MDMSFSFEHGMYWMMEKWKLAQLVYLNCQEMHSDFTNWMMPLAGSGFKTEGDHLNIKIVAPLFVIMPAHYISGEICDLKQVYLRCTAQGVPTFH